MIAAPAKPLRAALLFLCFAALLFAIHIFYLRLPYFWDELGQFVPAALDILRDNAWIPRSATPNVHPPGVMAYLAAIWRVFGYSIAATRSAMLVLAAFGALFTYLLAKRLNAPFWAVLLLLCDPLFYTQAMMAQLDMPAMVFCLLALVLFFDERHAAAAVASTAAVLSKETSILLPLVFAAVLLREGRVKPHARYYVIPFVALAVWIVVLWSATGTPFGNRGFAHYNLGYALNPVRAAMSIARRIYYLFIDNFRWVGTVAIVLAWRRFDIFSARAWRITMIFAAAHILLVSILGGAELERYLLPALPIFYIAAAAALSKMAPFARNFGVLAMCGGLIAGLFVNPVFPFPYEDNLAMTDFVELQQSAAQYLQSKYPRSIVYTAWPLTAALRRPVYGYVQQRLKTHETGDLRYSTLARLDPRAVDVLVMYSRTWEPRWGVLRLDWIARFLTKFYDYEPQMTAEQCRAILGLGRVARWEQRGQWIEVYAKASGTQNQAPVAVP